MSSNELINNLKKQAQNESEAILLYSLALARLVFKTVELKGQNTPVHNYYATQGMSDFEQMRMLLKALKESLSKIENNEDKQIELFGSKDSYNAFKSQVEVASNAADSLNRESMTSAVAGRMLLLLGAAVIATAFCALCAVMPWFVPVAILAGLVLTSIIQGCFSGNQLDKGSKVFNEMTIKPLDIKTGKEESTIFETPATFFKSDVVGNAIQTLGKGEAQRQYNDIASARESFLNSCSGSSDGYVDRDTRRNRQLASMRAADRAAYGCD